MKKTDGGDCEMAERRAGILSMVGCFLVVLVLYLACKTEEIIRLKNLFR